MKKLFKKTRVVYNDMDKTFDVEYKNFLFWRYYCCYKLSDYHDVKSQAQKFAIERAKALLETKVVWESE